MQILRSTFVALALVSTTACVSGGADEVIDLTPEGKADGMAQVHVDLAGASSQKFRVVCYEWFSCDLSIQITEKAELSFIGIDVMRTSDDATFRYAQQTVKCRNEAGNLIASRGLFLLGQISGGACSELKRANISSDFPREQFDITAYTTDPDGGGSFEISARWE